MVEEFVGFPGLGQTAQAGQREQWKQVRAHIHHYEQKLLDLQLDYQHKVNVVEALKLELRQTTKDTRDCEEKAIKQVQEMHGAYKKMQELDRQLAAVQADHVMLMEALLLEQQGMEADKKQLEQTRDEFTKHLQLQHNHLDKLRQQLLQAGATGSVVGPDASVADAISNGSNAGGVTAVEGVCELQGCEV